MKFTLYATRYTLHAIRYTLIALFLFVCFLPENAMAQFGGERNGMKKYSLWGDIVLQYDGRSTRTDNTYMFTQNLNLNFRSYLISPKIMDYTINAGFDMATGTMSDPKGTGKSYGIETFFFRGRPFNLSLKASSTESMYDYKSTSYGLSMTYTRKVKRVSPRPTVPREEDVNRNLNKNANINANTNTNANTDENANGDDVYGYNVAPKPQPKVEGSPPKKSGLFYDIVNILPITTSLSVDRATYEYKGLKSGWDGANLGFFGVYGRTRYIWNLDYNNWRSDSGGHKGFGSDLTTQTSLNWRFFDVFENRLYYRKNDITSYNINSSLTRLTKKWNYGIYGSFFLTSDSESYKQYSITASASSGSVYKGVDLSYALGLGFEHSQGRKDDLFGTGSLSANKRLGLNTNVNSSLSLRGGAEGSRVDFTTGINYTFRPRKGYILSVEFDPRKESLKTKTLKPQAPPGWDYIIRMGYLFGISRDTRNMRSECTTAGCTTAFAANYTTNETITTHRGDLNVNIYVSGITLSSDAFLYYSSNLGKRFEWNNSIYATVMRKIGVTIGTGLTVDMPETGIKTTNYNIYNLITYNLRRNALLRIDTRYTKIMPDGTITLVTTPSLVWQLRKVSLSLDLTLIKEKTSSGSETSERRIMLRVTRPFTIL